VLLMWDEVLSSMWQCYLKLLLLLLLLPWVLGGKLGQVP
jgi:hypothetical protein